MSNSIKNSIGGTLQDIVNLGIETPFTERELRELGVIVPEIYISSSDIKNIRSKLNVSQAVFARILNVSLSSVRQWEQGKRQPTGSTKVLLELLMKTPHLLDYRLCA